MNTTDLLLSAIGALLTVQVGLLGWFLNKIWDRQDKLSERQDEQDNRIAELANKSVEIKSLFHTMTELQRRQEEFQELVFKKIIGEFNIKL